MVNLRRVTFTHQKIKKIIDDGPPKSWGEVDTKVRSGKLFIGDREVVPKEKVREWLHERLYNKSKKPIPLSRDAGYTDFIARETLGISRRVWFDFLAAQNVHQRFSTRPKPTKLPGRKLSNFGFLEMDLVEVKAKDLPYRKTDTFIFTLVDRLSSYLVAKRVDTKAVDPPTKRGTLVVFKELLAEMRAALPTSVKEISSDAGGEFKGAMLKYLEQQGIKKRIVNMGGAIESRNGVLQRHLYRLINGLGRPGKLDKHIKEAVQLCNETTSRITKQRPVDALKMKPSELVGPFNNARQRPGKRVGPKIKKGDTVIILDSKATQKKGTFYKSYRDHWSRPQIVERVQGNGVFVKGESYPISRAKKVRPLDPKSVPAAPPRKKYKKRAKEPIKLRPRSTRATKKLWSDRKKNS